MLVLKSAPIEPCSPNVRSTVPSALKRASTYSERSPALPAAAGEPATRMLVPRRASAWPMPATRAAGDDPAVAEARVERAVGPIPGESDVGEPGLAGGRVGRDGDVAGGQDRAIRLDRHRVELGRVDGGHGRQDLAVPVEGRVETAVAGVAGEQKLTGDGGAQRRARDHDPAVGREGERCASSRETSAADPAVKSVTTTPPSPNPGSSRFVAGSIARDHDHVAVARAAEAAGPLPVAGDTILPSGWMAVARVNTVPAPGSGCSPGRHRRSWWRAIRAAASAAPALGAQARRGRRRQASAGRDGVSARADCMASLPPLGRKRRNARRTEMPPSAFPRARTRHRLFTLCRGRWPSTSRPRSRSPGRGPRWPPTPPTRPTRRAGTPTSSRSSGGPAATRRRLPDGVRGPLPRAAAGLHLRGVELEPGERLVMRTAEGRSRWRPPTPGQTAGGGTRDDAAQPRRAGRVRQLAAPLMAPRCAAPTARTSPGSRRCSSPDGWGFRATEELSLNIR